ncbi:MAG: HD domain-containing protein [Clostridiales bacterium]|nr:HD domain-containing protein [Clostridiales bacterium]
MTQEKTGLAQKELVHLLLRTFAVLKIGKVYDFGNQIVQDQFTQLYSALKGALETEGEIVLRVRQNAILVNGVRVKFDYSNYHIFKSLCADFQTKEIAAISFSPEMQEDELQRFMRILLRKDLPSKGACDQVIEAMDRERIDHILVEKIAPVELNVSREKSAVRMYFAGIHLLKEAFEKQKQGASVNFNLMKRWMQSIFNHILDDESFVYGLTNIKNHDDYTLNHSINVCILAVALGRRLGLTREELLDLGISAFLHDVGKLDVPKEILDKPSQLTGEERAVVERHVQHGAEKLIELKSARRLPLRAVQVALEHHLKADMSEYPRYLRKSTSNIFSKIVKIVDYFDAITTPRVYRPQALTREEALNDMREKSGDEFNPTFLRAFASMIGAYPVGSLVVLDSGEIGIVFEANPHAAFQLRPEVKLIADSTGRMVDGEVVDLSDIEVETGKFRRTIVRCLNPDKCGIRVADYFLARAA